jgi:hypothetical protein
MNRSRNKVLAATFSQGLSIDSRGGPNGSTHPKSRGPRIFCAQSRTAYAHAAESPTRPNAGSILTYGEQFTASADPIPTLSTR